MSDELIRQRKRLAMGEDLVSVPAISGPFSQVHGSDIPRGEMKDSQRRAGKTDNEYGK